MHDGNVWPPIGPALLRLTAVNSSTHQRLSLYALRLELSILAPKQRNDAARRS